ncbi:hypothetical protein [Stutzerimonas stutzeri]|uniref:hypothetical protein n=1 Tax=Stutzerimonas stutzeri TaxID=316 RepID=UPI000373352A|nr:hypothetical protein [Stutzerimonas stutzeri]
MQKAKAMLAAVLVCGALLMGCGKGSYETWPEKWDEGATSYFNEHVPPLRNLPGKIYHYQVTKYQSGNAEFFANSLYIDGKLVLNDLPNAAHKLVVSLLDSWKGCTFSIAVRRATRLLRGSSFLSRCMKC